jgi:endo-1,4-beta-D-glucanase Y
MDNRKIIVVLILAFLILGISWGYLFGDTLEDLKNAEKNCSSFMKRMMNEYGGVWAEFKDEGEVSEVFAVDHEVSSEGTSLMMWYSLLSEDKEAFDAQYNVTVNFLLETRYNVLYWKLNKNMTPYASVVWGSYSVAPDADLRMIRILFSAYDLWGDQKYLNLALQLGNGIKNAVASDKTLMYWFSWTNGWTGRAEEVFIAYMDWTAIKRLSEYDEEWRSILETNLAIVLNSQTSDGLFYQVYAPEQGYTGINGTVSEIIHMSWTADKLLGAGQKEASQRFLNFTKSEYEKYGKIFGMYDVVTGKNDVDWDNIAAYAIIARLANGLGDRNFALRLLREKVLPQLITDLSSPLHGSFAYKENDANSFNNLEILITLRQIIDKSQHV